MYPGVQRTDPAALHCGTLDLNPSGARTTCTSFPTVIEWAAHRLRKLAVTLIDALALPEAYGALGRQHR